MAAAVPIALMPANLLHAGSRARSLKEAQSNLSVPLFVVSRIPIVQMFLQKKGFAWLTWVPISGQTTLLSRALRAEALPFVELLKSCAVPGLPTPGRRLREGDENRQVNGIAPNPAGE